MKKKKKKKITYLHRPSLKEVGKLMKVNQYAILNHRLTYVYRL